jgi:hypothetical protein
MWGEDFFAFLSRMNAFERLNKAGTEQGYQPMCFEG